MRQATNGEKSCLATWEHDIGGGVRARVTGVWGLLYTTGLRYYHPPIQLLLFISILSLLRNLVTWGFPGGPVVKDLPCSAGDMGSIPGQGTKIPQTVG